MIHIHQVFKRDNQIVRSVEWIEPSALSWFMRRKDHNFQVVNYRNDRHYFFSDVKLNYEECAAWLWALLRGELSVLSSIQSQQEPQLQEKVRPMFGRKKK